MYIERKTQPYTKYINRNLWEQALAQGGSQAEKLEEFFRRFHKGPQELKMAIDNVTLRFFPNLLQCCLESLTFLSKSDLKCQCYYIEQILESSTVELLFFNELDIMNRKTYQTQNEITDYKKFINYFLRFVECSLKLKLRQLPKYINKIEQIVSSLQKRNSNFQQEFETIQKLKDQIDILNNNQPNKNNNVNNNIVKNNNVNNNVNSGPYQQKNSENQYRPRDFQVEFLQDTHNNNTNLPQNSNSLNNPPQIQSQQFVQIQPIMNNSQPNLQQPSYGFHNTNNVNTQQKEQDYFQQQSHGTFVQKNSQYDNDNSSGFETLQLNSISQFSQKQYLPQQSNQQISFIPQQSNSYLQTQQKQYPPQQSIQYSQIQQNQVQNNQQNSYQQIPQPQYSTQYNQPQNQMYIDNISF